MALFKVTLYFQLNLLIHPIGIQFWSFYFSNMNINLKAVTFHVVLLQFQLLSSLSSCIHRVNILKTSFGFWPFLFLSPLNYSNQVLNLVCYCILAIMY